MEEEEEEEEESCLRWFVRTRPIVLSQHNTRQKLSAALREVRRLIHTAQVHTQPPPIRTLTHTPEGYRASE